MEVIKWRESYQVGVPSMDIQHRELIELINKLYQNIRLREEENAITEILDRCISYGANHLSDEEKLLSENEYPLFDQHINEHKQYIETITSLREKLDSSPDIMTKEVYAFLRKWWISHIVESDKKYGPFLLDKGVQ